MNSSWEFVSSPSSSFRSFSPAPEATTWFLLLSIVTMMLPAMFVFVFALVLL